MAFISIDIIVFAIIIVSYQRIRYAIKQAWFFPDNSIVFYLPPTEETVSKIRKEY